MKLNALIVLLLLIASTAMSSESEVTYKNNIGSKLVIKEMSESEFGFDFEGYNYKTKKYCGGPSGFSAEWIVLNKKAKWTSPGGCEITFDFYGSNLDKVVISESNLCTSKCGKQELVKINNKSKTTDVINGNPYKSNTAIGRVAEVIYDEGCTLVVNTDNGKELRLQYCQPHDKKLHDMVKIDKMKNPKGIKVKVQWHEDNGEFFGVPTSFLDGIQILRK